jgi:hypothetical protein
MTMNEKNWSGDTRHVTTKVLERLQEGCPELFIHSAFHNWPEYILAAEEAGIVTVGETWNRVQWLELSD